MMVTANRQIARHESIEKMFTQVWQRRTSLRRLKDRGFVVGIGKQIKKLKWTWEEPFNMIPKEHRQLPLACPFSGWFKHHVRQALGQAELVKPYERKDMAGLENGVECEHSVALLRSGELSEEDQGWIREIL